MELIELIDKYLVEGMPHGNAPSLDSLKYKGKDSEFNPDEMIKASKLIGGKSGEITTKVMMAIKKKDKKTVQKFVDKESQNIMGIYDVLQWLKK